MIVMVLSQSVRTSQHRWRAVTKICSMSQGASVVCG